MKVFDLPENKSKLIKIKPTSSCHIEIIKALKDDNVALIREVTPSDKDSITYNVAKSFGLETSLELFAGFASSIGRENVNKYSATVNSRDDYQFITPHSEGGSTININLTSFYCFENTTDGGHTMLFNTNQKSDLWSKLYEKVKRFDSHRELSQGEIMELKITLGINYPYDKLKDTDEVLTKKEFNSDIMVYEVLAKLETSYSTILNKDLYVYWNTVGGIDKSNSQQYVELLKQEKLLIENNMPISKLSSSWKSHVRSFHSNYNELFKSKITYKLEKNDLIFFNNQSWTHSATNWTPNTGVRKIVAAFA